MKITQKSTFLAYMLFALLAVLLLNSACSTAPDEAAAAPPANEGIATPEVADVARVPVAVAPVETGDISLLLNYSGNLEPVKDIQLVPKVSGQIERVLVEVGDPVKAGDSIAIVEDDTYAAQVKQAKSALKAANLNLDKMELGTRAEELAAARSALQLARAALDDTVYIDDNERTSAAANLANAQAALRAAQSEYDKIAWAGQVGTTPQALQLERATTAYEQSLAAYNLQTNPADAQLAPLESQVVQAELKLALSEQPFRPVDFDIARTGIEQAEAALDLANLQLEYTTITAPYDGIIAELHIEEGSMVGPQVPVARVVSNEIEVKVSVEEGRLGQLYKGQHVALNVAAYPGVDFPAVVSNVAPVADAKTHTFMITVTPMDKKGLLRGGMFADTTLLAEEKDNTLLVPLTAVTTVNNKPTIYVVGKDTSVEQRTVTTGLSNKTQIEILSGVKVDELVVTDGQVNLIDGAPVKVVPEI